MNGLRIFENSEFGQLSVLEIDGREYFPATACARVLGYAEPQRAIRQHCRGCVKRTGVSHTTNQYGTTTEQITEMNYIPEGDLYRLIIRSNLPAAERFERWVFDEVLPTIRRQGGYAPDMSALIAQTAEATVKAVMAQLAPLLLEQQRPERRVRHRSQGIGALDVEVRQDVEDMILTHRYTYTEVAELMMQRYGIKTSKSAIGRYANQLYDRLEWLR